MSTVEAKDRLYPPRPAHNVQEIYTDLLRPPENPLTEVEKVATIAFDTLLTRGKNLTVQEGKVVSLDDAQTDSHNLEETVETAILQHTLYPEYFFTPGGIDALQAFFPYAQLDQYSQDDLRMFLQNLRKRDVDRDRKGFLKLAKASRDYTEEQLQKAFRESSYNGIPAENLPERISVIEDPTTLLKVVRFYRERKRLLKSVTTDTLNRGEVYFLNLHRMRINSLLANSYSQLLALVSQYYGETSAQRELVVDEIRSLMKGTATPESTPLDPARSTIRTAQMDKFVLGSADSMNPNNPGYYSVIDDEAIDLFKESMGPSDVDQVDNQPLISAEQAKKKTSATLMKEWFEEAMKEYGLLSGHQHDGDKDFARSGTAPDGKWQVVIHPTSTTLSVSFHKQLVSIPPRYAKPLSSAVGVLDHEMAHVMQCHLAKTLGIPFLDIVKTGRTSSLHEAGAIEWERQAKQEFFGEKRDVGFAYMKAIERREEGGTFGDCVKAYYDEKVRSNPDKDQDEIVNEAVNRTFRLFRGGGNFADTSAHVYDSQTLSYIEQELFRLSADQAGMKKMLLVGNVHPAILLELFQLGFVDLGNLPFPKKRPSQMIRDTILAYAQT